MANHSQKKISINNKETLKSLFIIQLTLLLINLIISYLKSTGFTTKMVVLLFLINSAFCLLFFFFHRISAKQDLNSKGVMEYFKDFIYLGWIVMVLSPFSMYFAFLYVGVPVYVLYKVFYKKQTTNKR